MITFGFFSDASLKTPIEARLQFIQESSVPTQADKVIYFGSPEVGHVVKATSNPGTDPILVSVADALPAGGNPSTDVRLALSAAGLDTATGGADLDLGVELASGVSGAVAIHMRVIDSTGVVGKKVDLSLITNDLTEWA